MGAHPTADGQCSSIEWRDLFVVRIHGVTTRENHHELAERLLAHARGREGGVGCIVVIDLASTLPDEPTRQEILDALVRIQERIRAIVWVVEATGFRGATARAILTGVRRMLPVSAPGTVLGDVASAIRWILPKLDGGADRARDLDAAYAAIGEA
jgi:hypothetical protein